jgi:hypothetical protein
MTQRVGHEARGEEVPTVVLESWHGPWPADDTNANFKLEVANYCLLDPLMTLRGMSAEMGIPIGALARYVLSRWATAGSGGLLELGPTTVQRLWAPIEAAERSDDDAARLTAYRQLKEMISWLKAPLDDPSLY